MFVKDIKSCSGCSRIVSQAGNGNEMLWGILLLVDLAAVGEALVWCKLGDIHQGWKMKIAHYLFNVCV